MSEILNALCGQNDGQCAGDDENARLVYWKTGPRSYAVAMQCEHCERADTHTAHAGGAEVWPGAMCRRCRGRSMRNMKNFLKRPAFWVVLIAVLINVLHFCRIVYFNVILSVWATLSVVGLLVLIFWNPLKGLSRHRHPRDGEGEL